MRYLKYIWLFAIIGAFSACTEDEDALTASTEDLFPPKQETEIDLKLKEMFAPFNTIVEYRYIKNYVDKDWYYITPPQEDLVVPMGQFLLDYWVGPLEAASSTEFVAQNFPKKIILIGSPAYKLDGSRVLGQAEAGTLIRYTEVNRFDLTDVEWMRMQLHTAFHEYAHILHQTFKMPDIYRAVTPDNYTKSGWQAVITPNEIERGMVTPYGTNSVADDFAELFAGYIIYSDEDMAYLLLDEEINFDPEQGPVTDLDEIAPITRRNEGRAFIRTKLGIMNKFLKSVGFDLEQAREEAQQKLNS